MSKSLVSILLLSCCVFSFKVVANAPEQLPQFVLSDYVTDLNQPMALAFLNDHDALIILKAGRVLRVNGDAQPKEVVGGPQNIYIKGQGGLLDIVLHPNFIENRWLYLSYSAGTDSRNSLLVTRYRLENNTLVDPLDVLRVKPSRATPVHYGAKMTFLPDNTLLVSSGDGFDYREDAQRKHNQMGKMLRINDDGSVPATNPFVLKSETSRSDDLSRWIYSLGHRNPQGLVYDPVRNKVLSHEHGPAGGDEINVIRAGYNYGWPIITQGKDYSGARISPFTEYPGMEQPILDWTPSVAPSGLMVYYGRMFPQLRGDLFVSTLKSQDIILVHMEGDNVVGQTSLFAQLGYRFRNVYAHPNGALLLFVDGTNGKILRVTN